MPYVPYIDHPMNHPPQRQSAPPHITVHALKENKRPVGFAPWPEQPKRKRAPRKPPAKP